MYPFNIWLSYINIDLVGCIAAYLLMMRFQFVQIRRLEINELIDKLLRRAVAKAMENIMLDLLERIRSIPTLHEGLCEICDCEPCICLPFAEHWSCCPECGCTESNGGLNSLQHICADCGQEWYEDINYIHSAFRWNGQRK